MSNRTTTPTKTRQGAGVLAVARRTSLYPGKPILLGKRSRNVRSPLTWAPLGGWIEPGEEPATAARREFTEESGHGGAVELVDGSHWEHRIGFWPLPAFSFHNFVGLVDDQFSVGRVQRWEVEEAKWFSLDEIDALTTPGLLSPFGKPGGIHPGLRAYLRRKGIRTLLVELCGPAAANA